MKIIQTKDFPEAEFEVSIVSKNNTVHNVRLSEDYYNKLTNGKIEARELIQLSFDFLLDREPNTSILSQFDLQTINDYFPEFEDYVHDELDE